MAVAACPSVSLAAGGVAAYQKLGPRIYKQPVTRHRDRARVARPGLGAGHRDRLRRACNHGPRSARKSPGRLARVFVKEGDVVKAGDVIARAARAPTRRPRSRRGAIARRRGARRRANGARQPGGAGGAARTGARSLREPAGDGAHGAAGSRGAAEGARRVRIGGRRAGGRLSKRRSPPGRWALRIGSSPRRSAAPSSPSRPRSARRSARSSAGIANIAEIADFSSMVVEADVPEARLSLVDRGRPGRDRARCLPDAALPRDRGRASASGSTAARRPWSSRSSSRTRWKASCRTWRPG